MGFWRRQRQRGGFFAYRGRIGRFRFFVWNFLLNISAIFSLALMINQAGSVWSLLLLPVLLVIVVLQCLNYAKRLQDINMPGWIGFIFIIGLNAFDVITISEYGTANGVRIASAVSTLLLVIIPGTKGPNKYGQGYGEAEDTREAE